MMLAKTTALIDAAADILAECNPMTLRQLFYQLVSRQVIENTVNQYKRLSGIIADARKAGSISWDWIEDRLRRPRSVSMWSDLSDFASAALASYRRDVWTTQPQYVTAWLEKDALSGIFEDALNRYGVTLHVGRGFDSWSSIREAAELLNDRTDEHGHVTLLYFGDFDPSGEDMVRSLGERLAFFDCRPEIIKCALTSEDIDRYRLPPSPTKTTDSRRQAFIDRHGDRCVELDALPAAVLRSRLVDEVEARMDLSALAAVRDREQAERSHLSELLEGAA